MTDPFLKNLSLAQPARLARLMTDAPSGSTWEPSELGAILRHQLIAPLEMSISKEHNPASTGAPATFLDLLQSPNPPVDMLESVRDLAKSNMSDPAAHLPREVAAVLYYGSILLALLRRNARISRLKDHELLRGLEWVLAQSWLDPATRAVFMEGRDKITALL